jgi:acyl transferase domain-containing protein/NADPH:quinone reductase-like Zn-dependent oxidoreductase/NADP-dependent 3-hydroxy acid dehydrogenase YdfG
VSDRSASPSLSPLKQAYLKLEELQSRLESYERRAHEPIAVIGIGCRLPGGVVDPASYWQLLLQGVDATCEVPPGRWDVDRYYDPNPDAPGKTYVRRGGYLERVDTFDPQFFGISPREAAVMDPQQRLLLEVAWEALEHAGEPPRSLEGSRTGVFVAVATNDYWNLQVRQNELTCVGLYHGSGIANSVASGRSSYVFGLVGPAVTVDTACSSSLVAVHLACKSVLNDECRMAIAGGVNVILAPENRIIFAKSKLLARDGRCRTFDAEADGFAEAEGCALIVLKRLSDAIADGNRVLAVIRGSAMNQDGPSSGLTAPNGPSQESVVRSALAAGGVKPFEVGYVEGHGTGTTLGDPIEVQALAAALGPGRDRENPLWIGSVKTNFGHLEAAAGVTGLVKVVLALANRTIPAHLHFRTPNPFIPWNELPVAVPTQAIDWKPINGRRIAGVSAFGFSGTNVHVVLEEAPALVAPADAPAAEEPSQAERPAHLMALSARNAPALREMAGQFAKQLADLPPQAVAGLCHSANLLRSYESSRLAVVGASSDEIRQSLDAYAQGAAAPGIIAGVLETSDRPKLAFLFTGQGSQYAGMARGLYDTQPTFRRALDRCAEILRPHLDDPLLSVVHPAVESAGQIDRTVYTQPALFAIEYALAELWQSWGVHPSAVIGHSLGEYVAACVAGACSLEDVLPLVATRARLMQALPEGGAMAAIFADEARVASALQGYDARVAIAAVNGAANVVISGDAVAVEEIAADLARDGITSKRLTVSHAFHSPLMDPMLDAFASAAEKVSFSAPRIPLASNVTGTMVRGDAALDAPYWRRHVRQPVRFADGMRALHAAGVRVFLEIGPHPTLIGMGRRALAQEEGLAWLPSLERGRDDWRVLLGTAGALFTHGVGLDWKGFDRNYRRTRVDVPPYPFQRQRCWFDMSSSPAAGDRRPRRDGSRPGGHPLLQRRLRSAVGIFESDLDAASVPFLVEHRVRGRIVLPAAAYLEALRAASASILEREPIVLEDIVIGDALAVGDGEHRTMQVVVTPVGDEASLQVFSAAAEGDDPWRLHASGRVRACAKTPQVRFDKAARMRCADQRAPEHLYDTMNGRGLGLGPAFQGVEALWRGRYEALGQLGLTDEVRTHGAEYGVHPALLDAALQVFGAALPDDPDAAVNRETYLPLGIDRVAFHAPARGNRFTSHVTVRPFTDPQPETLDGDVRLFDESDTLVVEISGLRLKRMRPEALPTAADEVASWLYQVEWEPKPLDTATAAQMPFAASTLRPLMGRDIQSLKSDPALVSYNDLVPQLESAAGAWVARALRALDWTPSPGDRVTTDALADHLGVVPRHHRLFHRLLGILAEDGFVQADGAEWIVRRSPQALDPGPSVKALIAAYPEYDAEITLLDRCGPALAAALRGDADPLELLFPGGDLSTAERLYEQSPLARAYNGLVRTAVATAVEALGPNRTARILEIGAGTGGTTSGLLPSLAADRTEYVFTDVSRAFTTSAAKKYHDYPFVQYRTLDIEADPAAQGFSGARFDVIVAANVLHATRSLRDTLRHVLSLLTPGGVLVLLEMTRPQRDIDVVFGLTDGWWRFIDYDLRPASLLLPAADWLAVLRDLGFRDAIALPDRADAVDGCAANQTVIVAAAPVAAAQGDAAAGAWLVFEDAAGCGLAVADALVARGERAVRVARGAAYARLDDSRVAINPESAADYIRALELEPEWRGVVHLWSLDGAPGDASTAETLAADQALGTRSVLSLVQAMSGANTTPGRLVIGTRGAQSRGSESGLRPSQATVWGLAKVIALEHPNFRCLRVDLDPAGSQDEIAQLCAELLADGREDQVMLRGGERFVARLARVRSDEPTATPPVRFEVGRRGLLDTVAPQPATRRNPGPGEVEIRVEATGLNFRDVMGAMGIYPGDPGPLGSECAGTVVAVGEGVDGIAVGDEVLAIVPGCLATYVTGRADFVMRRPGRLSVVQAASVAIPYVTAQFTLHHVAALRPGESVLIHSAAGGVGLAAVQLARRAGAIVFATAGNDEKRAYLRSIGVNHVYDSRSNAFADAILVETGGRGVDVVLNSLGPDFVRSGLSVLAAGGRFVEIAKTGLLSDEERAALRPDIRYQAVDWSETARDAPAVIRGVLEELIGLFASGELQPLPLRTFAAAEAVSAFRFMAQARHIGKVVIVQAPDRVRAGLRIRPDASYLVTGGLRGIGLLVAEHLVTRGARHLVLLGRRAPDAAAQETITRLERQGATVVVARADVSRRDELERELTRAAAALPPLAGVIHSAGVLNDAVLQRLDWARVAEVLAPKVEGTWHLHELTRAASLDFFVLFSSIAGLLGSPGQGNHAAANAFLDTVAHQLRASGVPAVSINWGVWAEIGSAAERHVGDRLVTQGVDSITPALGLVALEAAVGHGAVQIAATPMRWSTFLDSFAAGNAPPLVERMADEVRRERPAAPASTATPPTTGILSRLEEAIPSKRHSLLVGYVREQVARVLGLREPEAVEQKQPFSDMGLDSLMAIELRNLLASGLGLKRGLPATVVFDYPNAQALAAFLETQLSFAATPAAAGEDRLPAAVEEPAADTLDSIEELSDEEVDRLFAARVEQHR